MLGCAVPTPRAFGARCILSSTWAGEGSLEELGVLTIRQRWHVEHFEVAETCSTVFIPTNHVQLARTVGWTAAHGLYLY